VTARFRSASAPVRSTTDRSTRRTAAQKVAAVTGFAFLLVGVAGFIPGITQNLDEIKFAGHDSGAELLGIFQVSVLHNFVHLAFGVIGLAAASRHSASRAFLIVGGLVYLALLVFGLVVDHQGNSNFVPVDDADDWLHLGLGVGMLALGLLLGDRVRRAPAPAVRTHIR
jgi:hypothetical protein